MVVNRNFIKFFLISLSILTIILSCGKPSEQFVIISGSENKSLEPILKEFGYDNGYDIHMKYKGSVDIMLELSSAEIHYDAVWTANSLWIALGDKNRRVKYDKSVMSSPVVFGIRKSLAQKLGFVGRDVKVNDILRAIEEKKLKFMMTSATQSNSGASAYIGFLYALLNNPDVMEKKDLHNPVLKKRIQRLLSGINRSSGSSGWLKDLFLKGNYDAMVNYEAMIIEANRELERQGKETLYVVYPVDGIVLADSPLGYIHHGSEKKEKFFKKLQAYLLSEKVQKRIMNEGRRIAFGDMSKADKRIFNPMWGIDTGRILSPITLPGSEVILEALTLYQTAFRKPSMTVFCLDFSGSMQGTGERELKKAMSTLLNQKSAGKYLIQASDDDIMMVVPFSNRILGKWIVRGNNRNKLKKLNVKIDSLRPVGSTDIYSPAIEGLRWIKKFDIEKYVPAIILMTDGESNTGKVFRDFRDAWNDQGQDIPVFSIVFGRAVESQLRELSDLTRGRNFDGRKDLIKAFRKAKGYN